MCLRKVSIIIPVYNGAAYIQETLKSVSELQYPEDLIQVIIVNDGSTDSTSELLENYKNIYQIIHTENKGVSHARNIGLKYANGEYIQFLDSDDLLSPDKLTIQVKTLIDEKADLVYSNWQKFHEVDGELIVTENIQKKIEGDPEIALLTDFWCPPAAILFRKEIVTRIGGFKEWLPMAEDARFFLDAAINKAKIVYSPVYAAKYRVHNQYSLSNINRRIFIESCYRNALSVSEAWSDQGVLTEAKKEALIKVLRFCVNEFSVINKKAFYDAIESLLLLDPHYIPTQPGMLRTLSIVFGYRTSEEIARLKRILFR